MRTEQLVAADTAGEEESSLLRMWPLPGFLCTHGRLQLNLVVYHEKGGRWLKERVLRVFRRGWREECTGVDMIYCFIIYMHEI